MFIFGQSVLNLCSFLVPLPWLSFCFSVLAGFFQNVSLNVWKESRLAAVTVIRFCHLYWNAVHHNQIPLHTETGNLLVMGSLHRASLRSAFCVNDLAIMSCDNLLRFKMHLSLVHRERSRHAAIVES